MTHSDDDLHLQTENRIKIVQQTEIITQMDQQARDKKRLDTEQNNRTF